MGAVDWGAVAASAREVATGLGFPEGPVWTADGDLLFVDIRGRDLCRLNPATGRKSVVAHLGGGPNGAAIGPDGRCYVCNNGGLRWREADGLAWPDGTPDDWSGGSVQAVDLRTGAVETLYREVDGWPLRGPNDLVFDRDGGFWFTDHGKWRPRDRDFGGVYYARADKSHVEEAVFRLTAPNGIALSPDGAMLYVAVTEGGRCHALPIESPGRLCPGFDPADPAFCLYGAPGLELFDSMAVDEEGRVCVAALLNGGVRVIAPDGEAWHVPIAGDPLVTNLCFGGPDRRTAYVTLSGSGRMVALDWPCAGAPLSF